MAIWGLTSMARWFPSPLIPKSVWFNEEAQPARFCHVRRDVRLCIDAPNGQIMPSLQVVVWSIVVRMFCQFNSASLSFGFLPTGIHL